MSTRVMIADDHVLVRQGLRQLLEYDGTMEVVSEAGNGKECIEKCIDVLPDILLLDINMPELNGLEALKTLKEKNVPVKILILTIHNEVEYLVNAIEMGVEGYILKDTEYEELKKAITTIMNGKSYIQPALIPYLNSYLIKKDTDADKIQMLTKRELEVLIKVAEGNFNRDIALKLNISERTVKNHLSSIFKKLDVNDRTQAAVFAIKNNILKFS